MRRCEQLCKCLAVSIKKNSKVSFVMLYTKLPTTFPFPSSLSLSLLLRFTDDTFDPEIGATIGKCVNLYMTINKLMMIEAQHT